MDDLFFYEVAMEKREDDAYLVTCDCIHFVTLLFMQKQKDVGVYQLANGNCAFRYGVVVNGKTHWKDIIFSIKIADIILKQVQFSDIINMRCNERRIRMLGETAYQPYAINTFSHNGRQFTTIKPAHYVSAHSVKPYYRKDGTFVSGYWRDGDNNKAINTHTKYVRGNPNAAPIMTLKG